MKEGEVSVEAKGAKGSERKSGIESAFNAGAHAKGDEVEGGRMSYLAQTRRAADVTLESRQGGERAALVCGGQHSRRTFPANIPGKHSRIGKGRKK